MGLSHIITKRLTSDCLIYEYIIIHVTNTWRKAIDDTMFVGSVFLCRSFHLIIKIIVLWCQRWCKEMVICMKGNKEYVLIRKNPVGKGLPFEYRRGPLLFVLC